jgi:ParB-like chromosome segregation protein Spo0J
MFPRISADELAELGADIKANGLQTAIVMIRESGKESLLDGISRLDAIEAAGIDLVMPDGTFDRTLGLGRVFVSVVDDVDPYAFVISANAHRRHLTTEQKRDLIEKIIKATPESSNRQIAKLVKVDHKTVATIRAKKEATGEIPQLTKTVGADGRSRPVQRIKPAPAADAEAQAIIKDELVFIAMEQTAKAIARSLKAFTPSDRQIIWKRALALMEARSRRRGMKKTLG